MFLNWNLIWETLWTGARNGLLISVLEKRRFVSFDWAHNAGAIDMKMDRSVI